jgi:multidrug efflux pump subunit AcrB
MMKKALSLALAASLVLGASACSSGPGPDADEGKTTAQVQEAAKAADAATLQTVVDEYKAAIAKHEGELKALQEQIGKAAGGAIDGLLGGEKKDEPAGDVASLKQDAEKLAAKLEELGKKLQVYVDELAAKNKA